MPKGHYDRSHIDYSKRNFYRVPRPYLAPDEEVVPGLTRAAAPGFMLGLAELRFRWVYEQVRGPKMKLAWQRRRARAA